MPSKLYWLDEGGPWVPRKVAAANLDGSQPEILVKKDLTHLDFLSIDINTQALYWSEGHAGKVSTGRMKVYSTCNTCTSAAVFERQSSGTRL